LPTDVAETVDALWAEELARRPHAFDGPVFSVTRRDGMVIAGQWTTYRRFMARRRQPGLAEALGVRPLAVTGLKRSAAMPELPTLAESALPGFEVNGWYGLFAPRGTAPATIAALQEATAKAMRRPAVAERLSGDGAVAVTNTPAAFAKYLRADSEKWAKVIKRAKLAPETL
jgi:hypothetical protein